MRYLNITPILETENKGISLMPQILNVTII
jgi:hypothetical protein